MREFHDGSKKWINLFSWRCKKYEFKIFLNYYKYFIKKIKNLLSLPKDYYPFVIELSIRRDKSGGHFQGNEYWIYLYQRVRYP